MEKYNLLVEKSSQFARTCSSKFYRRKSKHVCDFLKLFIDDALRVYPFDIERRASAIYGFEKAIKISDKFIGSYFTDTEIEREEELEMLKDALDRFEYFIKAYPESRLIEYAQNRIDVLEKLYRAFMKG